MRSFGLVGTFAFRSLVIVVLMTAALSWAVLQTVERVAVEKSGETGRLTAQLVISHHLSDHDLSDPLAPESVEVVNDFVVNELLNTDIVAVKIWDLDRRLIYSSNGEDEIGSSHSSESGIDRVISGEVVTNIERSAKSEDANQYAEYGDLIEVYAPLVGENGETVGIIEIYEPYAVIQETIKDANLLILAIIVVGSLVIYVTQIRIVRSVSVKLEDTEKLVGTVNERLQGSLKEVEESSLGTLQALVAAVDAKDSYTARHSLGVTDYAVAIGHRMGLSHEELVDLERASLLHDIGKIGVPESVLLKPSQLSDEEYQTIQEHSEMGAHIIGSIPFLAELVPIVRHHHERWDGKGYPGGLSREKVPRMARILAVADAFDAMTSNRPYRSALHVSTARAELLRHRGIQFDPVAVDALIEALDLGDVSVSQRYNRVEGAGSVGAA